MSALHIVYENDAIKDVESFVDNNYGKWYCYQVAMESTGIYWQPTYFAQEDTGEGQKEIRVVNARHMRNIPGRKTDIKDAAWIAGLLRAGLLRWSFVPEKSIRELRDLTRYRKRQVELIGAQKN